MPLSDRSQRTLARVLEAKPGGTTRPGQDAMVASVADAIEQRRHAMIEAGTGTGKSLAYLVPALESGRRTVVATATKALQDQLATSELPFLSEHLGRRVSWAVVKGRQSYACMAKLVERFGPSLDHPAAMALFDGDDAIAEQDVARWARDHDTGDRDDLDHAVSDRVWRSVSVSGVECPGAANCTEGRRCFAEAAVERAAGVDVVITNHHLYGHHLTSGHRLLPPHDVVVFDEAHKLEAAMSSAFGIDLGPARINAFLRSVSRLVDGRQHSDSDPLTTLRSASAQLEAALAVTPLGRLDPGAGDIGAAVMHISDAVGRAVRSLRSANEGDPLAGVLTRTKNQGNHLIADCEMALDLPERYVAWLEPGPVMRIAPIEVSGSLAAKLLVHRPVILTSATMSVAGSFAPLARRLGFTDRPLSDDPFADEAEDPIPRTYTSLVVEGSFDYPHHGLLYVAGHLPPPGSAQWADAALEEIAQLTTASGGRALVLTTSFAMVDLIAARLRGADFEVLVQGVLPKRRLIERFVNDETSTLVATMGYWEGIDVPGRSLSLVVIDRLPFPRPDDPLMQARRERVEGRGGEPFLEVDLPRATTLLAQGVGRLIRNEHDRGVVAILDSRMSTRRYGRRILLSLPRMARTGDRERAIRFLGDVISH